MIVPRSLASCHHVARSFDLCIWPRALHIWLRAPLHIWPRAPLHIWLRAPWPLRLLHIWLRATLWLRALHIWLHATTATSPCLFGSWLWFPDSTARPDLAWHVEHEQLLTCAIRILVMIPRVESFSSNVVFRWSIVVSFVWWVQPDLSI